jgi:hypothetical protein
MMARLFFALLILSYASFAAAHKPSDAYLWLDVDATAVHGRWDVALRDLDVVLALDVNHDDQLTWGEIRTRQTEINDYLLAHLSLMTGALVNARMNATTPCPLQVQDQAIDRHSDGTYLVLRFTAACAAAAGFTVDYRLFEDIDPTHRGVTRVSFAGHAPLPLVLDPAHGAVAITPDGALADQGPQTSAPSALQGSANGLSTPSDASVDGGVDPSATQTNPTPNAPLTLAHAGFLREGIHHILTGYDHILFLLCLLLPAVLKRRGTARDGDWEPVSLRDAVWPLLRVITAFTIAHSITLALASARIVHLSPRFIEPAIAVTIMLAALNNIWPVVTRRIAVITFFFGLIHGFGFAEVLRDLDLSPGDFAWALLQFNLGVEIGQLLVVAVAILPLYLLRQKRLYKTAVLAGGSMFGMTIAAIWFAERVFDFKVLPL